MAAPKSKILVLLTVASSTLIGAQLISPPPTRAFEICVTKKFKNGKEVLRSKIATQVPCPPKFLGSRDPNANKPENRFFRIQVPADFLCWDKPIDGVVGNPGNGFCDVLPALENGQPDPFNEDLDGDKLCTPADCQGPPCWDKDVGLDCDTVDAELEEHDYTLNGFEKTADGDRKDNEDTDGDGHCTPVDCRAAACFDLDSELDCDTVDENGVEHDYNLDGQEKEPDGDRKIEDLDHKNQCDVEDCRTLINLAGELPGQTTPLTGLLTRGTDLNGIFSRDQSNFVINVDRSWKKADSLTNNPNDCVGPVVARAIDAAGNLSCTGLSDADVPDSITVNLAAQATMLQNDPAPDCAANQFARAINASGVLSCNPITEADVPLAQKATALATDPAPDCPANQFAQAINASGVLSCNPITAADVPLAQKATALATDPAPDCPANQFARAIDASGVLSCSPLAAADVPLAQKATELANDPAPDCPANQFAHAINASGVLSCSPLAATDVPLAQKATELANDPADCPEGEFAHGIGANGVLSCNPIALSDVPASLGGTTIVAKKSDALIALPAGQYSVHAKATLYNESADPEDVAFTTCKLLGNNGEELDATEVSVDAGRKVAMFLTGAGQLGTGSANDGTVSIGCTLTQGAGSVSMQNVVINATRVRQTIITVCKDGDTALFEECDDDDDQAVCPPDTMCQDCVCRLGTTTTTVTETTSTTETTTTTTTETTSTTMEEPAP